MNLKNRKIIITAGGTIEPIDAVRYIGNFSSGKMGVAFVKVLKNITDNIVLIYGNINISLPAFSKNIKALTVEEMYKRIKEELTEDAILIMAAAVSDFKVKKVAKNKIKKSKKIILELIPTRDILKSLARYKKERNYFIGFAAETEDLIENAKRKMKEKKLDMIIANSITKDNNPFNSDYNSVTVITKDNIINLSKNKKIYIARKIISILMKEG